MLRRLFLLAFMALLTACQTGNVNQDYDASRDFAAYRSWGWKDPALQYRPDDPRIKSDLTDQRIREAISGQLDQRGLRPVQGGGAADLRIQAYLIVEQRHQQITTQYGGAWGGYYGGYWGGPAFAETRTVEYKVATIQIDMFDGRDGKLVWRGSAEQTMSHYPPTPQERAEAIRKTVANALTNYPPH